MDDLDLSDFLEDEDALIMATALGYLGIGLYLAMKKTTPTAQKIPEKPVKPVRKSPQTLGEMIRMMMEEAMREPGS